jgi:hypothetical protein
MPEESSDGLMPAMTIDSSVGTPYNRDANLA